MAYSIKQQQKHRGLGGGGMSEEATKTLRTDQPEPLHSGYMREGYPEGTRTPQPGDKTNDIKYRLYA